MTDRPRRPSDKLQAVLNHDAADPDDDLGADDRQARAAWFAALSPLERVSAHAAFRAFASGDEPGAEGFARELPLAPVFPLL